jgi:hypothetical protein
VSGETLGEVKVVRDMHERKAEMAKHADAFVALPGPSLGQRPTLIYTIIIIVIVIVIIIIMDIWFIPIIIN